MLTPIASPRLPALRAMNTPRHDEVEGVAGVALVEDDLARPEPPPYRHTQERGPLTIA